MSDLVGTRLDADDAARLWLGTRENPMIVTAVLELDGVLAHDALVRLVGERLLANERFRLCATRPRLPLQRPRWERPGDASPGAYVREIDIGEADEDALAHAASALAAEPMSPRLSPWHVWLVQRRDPASASTKSALVVRIHHVLADGVALMRVLFGFSDEGAGTTSDVAPPPKHEASAARATDRLRAAARLLANPPAARLGHGRLTGRRRLAWTHRLDLTAIREAARARGVRVNDVLLAAVATAIRERAPLRDAAQRFVAMVPVSLAHAERELANRYTSVFVELPTRLEDPELRILAAKAAMQRELAAASLAAGQGIRGLGVALGAHVERVGARFVSRKASLVVSNLAGPPTKLHVGGRTIDSIVFASPAAGTVPLSISAFGYGGALRVSVAVDAGVHEDERALAASIERALLALTTPPHA